MKTGSIPDPGELTMVNTSNAVIVARAEIKARELQIGENTSEPDH